MVNHEEGGAFEMKCRRRKKGALKERFEKIKSSNFVRGKTTWGKKYQRELLGNTTGNGNGK